MNTLRILECVYYCTAGRLTDNIHICKLQSEPCRQAGHDKADPAVAAELGAAGVQVLLPLPLPLRLQFGTAVRAHCIDSLHGQLLK